MSQQINLFNPRFERKKNYYSTPVFAGALGGMAAVLAVMAVLANSQTAALEAEAVQVKNQLAAVTGRKAAVTAALAPPPRSESLPREVDHATEQYRNLQQAAATLEQGQFGRKHGYSAYFQALARKRIDGLWLTGVTIQGSGDSISLQGRALKANLLPGYLDGLAAEDVLRGKSFGKLEMSEPKVDAVTGAAPAPVSASSPASVPAPAPRYLEFSLQSMAKAEQNEAGRP